MQFLCIIENNTIIAKGLFIPNASFIFQDNFQSITSYPDMGLFVLFEGSYIKSINPNYRLYVDEFGNTTRTIVFQSRNAAAKFVLGERGRTDDWK